MAFSVTALLRLRPILLSISPLVSLTLFSLVLASCALDPEARKAKYLERAEKYHAGRKYNEAILELTGQDTEIVELPNIFASLLSKFGWLPGAPLTRDQWLMLQHDNVAAKDAPGLEAFGIQPTPLASVAWEWLGRYHHGGKFAGRHVNLTAS